MCRPGRRTDAHPTTYRVLYVSAPGDGGVIPSWTDRPASAVPHRTPDLTPRERLAARTGHYLVFTLLFLVVYGGVVLRLGRFPEPLLLGILVVSLAKDLYDELRLRRGGMPLAYRGIEHAPSNAVLIAFILGGIIDPMGTVGGVSVETLALALAIVDLAFDLSQDLRA